MHDLERLKRKRHNPFYLLILFFALWSAIEKMYNTNINSQYISCNDNKECISYTESKKTKEKSKIKHFSSEDICWECQLYEPSWAKDSSGEYTHHYIARGDVHWTLKLYSREKLITSKENYERKHLCEKDGTKYAKMIKKGNLTFKL